MDTRSLIIMLLIIAMVALGQGLVMASIITTKPITKTKAQPILIPYAVAGEEYYDVLRQAVEVFDHKGYAVVDKLLICHGTSDGLLTAPQRVIDKVEAVWCCHPATVKVTNPLVASKVIGSWNTVSWLTINHRSRITTFSREYIYG